jgi:hypothetical protein
MQRVRPRGSCLTARPRLRRGVVATLVFWLAAWVSGCSAAKTSGFMAGAGSGVVSASGSAAGGGGGVGSGGGAGGGAPVTNGSLGGILMTAVDDGGPDALAPGDLPDPNCPAGVHTTVSGLVYDPSLQDPLYNITVFAPKSATLPVLPQGAGCLPCDALYPPFYGSAVTDATGHFTVSNVPPGMNVPLVVQTGKWRKEFMIPSVTACVDNPQPDKTLRLPKNAVMGDGNLPDIAISTGASDSLECLLLRIGVDADEWTAGPGAAGHIHIFHSNGATTTPPAPEAPVSLWDSTADLMKYDVTLLSCEGRDTGMLLTDANRQSLLDYTNMGGRVFASHMHYGWFNLGPFAPLNLATWYVGGEIIDDTMSFPGDIRTTLLNGRPFPEGVALDAWLGVVRALDPKGMLDIYSARHNADVLPPAGPPTTPSQPWIVLDPTVTAVAPNGLPAANGAQYFSVDTPIGASQLCGRTVYSDLHVSGGAGVLQPGSPDFTPDYPGFQNGPDVGTVPSGCAMHKLTPQEKVLEFMIFDLSSCLIPVGQPPRPPR